MSEFNFDIFDCEISPSEEIECIDEIIALVERLFGPVDETTSKDIREKRLDDGRFARVSRMVIRSELDISFIIDCTLFLPNESFCVENSTRHFVGYCVEFNIDTYNVHIDVQRGLSRHSIDEFGDSEIEPLGIDGADSEPLSMRLSDRSYLGSLNDVFA